MSTRGLGQYDAEYAHCSCFWGTEPSKYVKLVTSNAANGVALDLGAGEGKNAIFLAHLGYHVIAVECSSYAIRNFRNRLRACPAEESARIQIVETDARVFDSNQQFDVVIAYGLLHCLPSMQDLVALVNKMKVLTTMSGINVLATFTKTLPVPQVQDYLEPTLIEEGYLLAIYSDWLIESHENDIIEESHPTSWSVHKHSIERLIARKAFK